ncbi:response regulator transcription factor [Alteribacter populi]|uniref:response regulator transcription factor n=1 Tax=Alteribacter populi TaxID=2011011 RepID=UPI000BBA4AF3|nr:response regulator [Alteribacter populi]
MKGEQFSILICDDSRMVRKHLRETVELIGALEIFEAKDGQEAVESFRLHRPQIVIMDIIMPVKDGIQALKEISKSDSGVKVIMASSAGTHSHLKKTILLGAFATIQKPISEVVIRDIIYKALNNTRKSSNHI